MMPSMHASAVAINGKAVLIAGPSGAGKSELALRLIDRGATLVADDYVRLEARGGRLFAHAPGATRGLVEVRGVGIATLPFVTDVPVALIVRLDGAAERLPPPEHEAIDGVEVPLVRLDGRTAGAPIAIELLLNGSLRPVDP
jgi:serine kinase of HPr protein (carbohydrate metabolism regulator)